MEELSAEKAIWTGRDAAPSHCLFRIGHFSLLLEVLEKCSSSAFDAGGYKWRLVIYPAGPECEDKKDYISVSLELCDASSLPPGWEIKAFINVFIFNQLNNKYYCFQDGTLKHYHAMKTMSGILNFIDLETFTNHKSGYLIHGSCVFGAEIFVVKSNMPVQHLKLFSEPSTCWHTWKIKCFSTLLEEEYESDSFGSYEWKISLNPNGTAEAKGNSISMYLYASSPPPNIELVVDCTLRVKNQKNGEHFERSDTQQFAYANDNWGFTMFMPLSKLRDLDQGFLVDDIVIIEAEVKLLGLVAKDL